MDREFCKRNERLCLRMAWQAPDDDARETYVRVAQTWKNQASFFEDPDISVDDSE